MLRSVFMPLALMDEETAKKLAERDVSMIYERMDKAGGLAVNGYPTFMSMQFLTRDEVDRLSVFLKEL